MSVPRGRISFGAHHFPFSGFRGGGSEEFDLPVLPVRLRPADGPWSRVFNSLLDTASTISVVPSGLAERTGAKTYGSSREARGAGSPFSVRAAHVDLSIVDAHLPTVTCWEIADTTIWVADPDASLEYPVIGWDLLALFELSINHSRKQIELRYPPR